MRWIVLSLVLINLMVFAWQYIDWLVPANQTLPSDNKALPSAGLKGVASQDLPLAESAAWAKDAAARSQLAQQTITLLEELESNKVALRNAGSGNVSLPPGGDPTIDAQVIASLDAAGPLHRVSISTEP